MIVDDAVVVRGLFARWVEAEPDLEVVASLRTGREAVDQLERVDPDVVVLDVEMPELDGIAALPLLLEKKRDLVVIMASTLTRRNAEISLRALALGAADYIPKPDDNARGHRLRRFPPRADREDPRSSACAPSACACRRGAGAGTAPACACARRPAPRVAEPRDRAARRCRRRAPRVLLIGSSTGGPQALNAIVAQIGGVIDRAPVLITQHMPPTFTAILAEHLARVAKRPVREAVDGEEVNAGTIYLAPGGQHMTRRAPRRRRRDRARRRPADQFLQAGGRPAVLLRRRGLGPARCWRWCSPAWARTACAARRRSSPPAATSWRRTKRSSVVWGMPGQVAHAGLCSAVLPLDEIGRKLTRAVRGGAARDPARFRLSAPAAAASAPASCCRPRSNIWSKAGCCRWRASTACRRSANWSAKLKRRHAAPLAIEVVEAMTTNETFFFRDKMPFEHFRDTIMPALHRGARAREAHPHLVHRRRRPARSLIRSPWRSRAWAPQLAGWRDRHPRHRYVRRRAGEGQGRHLQPVRGAARAADPTAGEIFQPGRRALADRARDPRHGAVPPAQSAQRFLARSARSTWCSAATC